MNNQLYCLIKGKPKFNKVRLDYFRGLTREIVEGYEFFYHVDGKVIIENSSESQRLYVDYYKIWSKINTEIGCSILLTNELCESMVKEVGSATAIQNKTFL